jgi:hypothetical protein
MIDKYIYVGTDSELTNLEPGNEYKWLGIK